MVDDVVVLFVEDVVDVVLYLVVVVVVLVVCVDVGKYVDKEDKIPKSQ